MDDLGTLCVTFSANLDGLTAGAQQAQQQMNNVEQAANNASSNAGSGFMGAAQGVMQFATQTYAAYLSLKGYYDMIVNGASAMLSSAATAEQTGVAYTTLMHSASGASAELAKLNTFAATTPFQTQAIDDAGSKMLAFGFKAQAIIPDVTAIGDSLSALGKGTPAALNSIVDIFGKIQAAGKLTGGDMMQLSAWGIPAWNMLSQVMGKPVSVLQKMVSSGLVPAKTAIADLTAGMEKTFGGGMAKQANTFNGLMSTFQSNVTLAWNSFLGVNGGQVTKGSLFDIVEQGLTQVGNLVSNPAYQQFAQVLGQEVGSAVQKVGGFIASNVVPAFQSLGPLIGRVGTFLSELDFGEIIGDFGRLTTEVGKLLSPLQGLQGPAQQLASGFFSQIGPLITGTILPGLDTFISDLADFFTWINKGGPGVDVLRAGLIGIGTAIAAIQIGSFIATIPALVVGFITWAGAAWAAAIATIAATWPIIAIGAAIAIVVAGIVLAVQHWGDITNWLSGVWGAFSGWFMGLMGAIGAFFTGIWNGMIAGIQSIVSAGVSHWALARCIPLRFRHGVKRFLALALAC